MAHTLSENEQEQFVSLRKSEFAHIMTQLDERRCILNRANVEYVYVHDLCRIVENREALAGRNRSEIEDTSAIVALFFHNLRSVTPRPMNLLRTH